MKLSVMDGKISNKMIMKRLERFGEVKIVDEKNGVLAGLGPARREWTMSTT